VWVRGWREVLPGFRSRMIIATFHCIEKYPMSMAALKKLLDILPLWKAIPEGFFL
jgi:hypothetical protein